ncbi:MAG: plasmid pRiA4b ORF-3 family protein, partial [Dehalococcoidales bacterium]|nr:plasmid pRiA4b ORF-3 family protein [Dehalococcoidales bacterium]
RGWLGPYALIDDILEHEPHKRYPICLTGERACPPEDCGGTYRYAELLKSITDPDHEEYLDMMTWLGGHFDPDSFDAEIVNQRLRSMHV